VALDPKIRRELGQTVRLWGLALVCALAGSVTVSVTGRVAPGVVAFLVALAVLGPLLLVYERRHR
jgi:Flp pilus assembly protein TadB